MLTMIFIYFECLIKARYCLCYGIKIKKKFKKFVFIENNLYFLQELTINVKNMSFRND